LFEIVNARPWLSIWPPPPEAYEKYEILIKKDSNKNRAKFLRI